MSFFVAKLLLQRCFHHYIMLFVEKIRRVEDVYVKQRDCHGVGQGNFKV